MLLTKLAYERAFALLSVGIICDDVFVGVFLVLASGGGGVVIVVVEVGVVVVVVAGVDGADGDVVDNLSRIKNHHKRNKMSSTRSIASRTHQMRSMLSSFLCYCGL